MWLWDTTIYPQADELTVNAIYFCFVFGKMSSKSKQRGVLDSTTVYASLHPLQGLNIEYPWVYTFLNLILFFGKLPTQKCDYMGAADHLYSADLSTCLVDWDTRSLFLDLK